MTDPGKNAADRLSELIPPAMPLEVLGEYGLNVTIPQAQAITKEMIALSAYWIWCALQAGIPEQFGKTIWQSIKDHIQQDWESKYGLEEFSFDQFLVEMQTRHSCWEEIERNGGEPITVISQAACDLDDRCIVPQGNQQYLVALFLDFVPIEEIGAVAEAIEEGTC